MHFYRSHDPQALNALLNHPSIRPHLMGDDELDGTDLLASGAVFYLAEGGGAIFHGGDGVYEGHYLFLPETRGKRARDLATCMIRAITITHAHRCLWGRVELVNRPARLFTRMLGFVSAGFADAPLPVELFIWAGTHGRHPRSNHRLQKGDEAGDGRCQ